MAELKLIKAHFAMSFDSTLRKCGIDTERYLRASQLNRGLIGMDQGAITVHQLWNFCSDAANDQGLFNLGLLAGSAPFERYTDIGRELLFSATLYQALSDLCRTARSEDQTAEFWLSKSAGLTWFCGTAGGPPEAVRQFELYRYRTLLQIIRWAAGPDWLPPQIRLQSSDDDKLRDEPLIRDINTHFSSPCMAIGIEPHILGCELRYAPQSESRRIDSSSLNSTIRPNSTFEESLKEIVRTQIRSGHCSAESASLALGISSRSLRRRLSYFDMSFRQLIVQTRIELARQLIDETELSTNQIARKLGYSHHSHLSRA